jgi:uncharacterized protein YbjT (DUF2867 family)
MYAILGASGKTGSAAAETLLAAGRKVRAIGRSAAHLEKLVRRGAEAAVGNATDAEFLTHAFDGVEGVYAMEPVDYTRPDVLGQYARLSEAISGALRRAAVRRVVALSSLGGELPAGSGPIAGLHGFEQALAATGADRLVLRPGYFFENFFGSLPVIRQAGVNGGAFEPQTPVPMTATRDIGAAAADELMRGDFRGVEVRELTSPDDLDMTAATRLLGAAIGKPDLAYVRFPDEGFMAGIVQAGFSRDAAGLLLEMAHAFNAGLVARRQPRTPRTTAPTRFSEFVPVLAGAYGASGP